MVTKEQTYQIALDRLNEVWNQISKCADVWAGQPQLRLSVVTVPAQTTINTAIRDIQFNADELGKEDAKTKAVLSDIVDRLQGFRMELAKVQELKNAVELIDAWKRSLKSMMDDLVEVSPEIAEAPLYRNLVVKLKRAA